MASHSLLGAPSLPLGQDGGALALGITAVFPKKVPTGGQRGTVPETSVKMGMHAAGQRQTWFSHLHPDLLLEKQFDPDTKCVEKEGVKVREDDDKNMEKSYPQLVKGFKAKMYFTVSFCNPSLQKDVKKERNFSHGKISML